jgi:anti-sigma B factor antagonist
MSTPAVRLAQPPTATALGAAGVTRQTVGRRAVLSVSGEIDIGSVPVLADAVAGALAEGVAELWIDLSHTDFMDSAGLHLLLDTLDQLNKLNRRLAIICPGGSVRRLFDVAGLSGRLPLYADRTSAHRAA